MAPRPAAHVTLRVLGTDVGVPAAFADEFGELPRSAAPARTTITADTIQQALTELTRVAVEHSPLLCIHAGVIAHETGFLAFPGPSGLGKTTLVAALVRAGLGYVSDEALAIDRSSRLAQPFARPLALTADVWPPALGEAPLDGTERLIQPSLLGRVERGEGRVRHIVLVERRPGAAQLRPAERGDAVAELLRRSFNHYRAPGPSFRSIVALVRSAEVWRAEYQDAADLAALLPDVLDLQPAANPADTVAK